jgi:toxin ParE1/3/4
VKGRVFLSPAADRDIDGHLVFIAKDNPEAAMRFMEVAADTCVKIAQTPGMGSLRKFGIPRLEGIRMFPLPGFDKYLVFYRATSRKIEIVRVLHAARDIAGIINADSPGRR